jgi:hypothetical protein
MQSLERCKSAPRDSATRLTLCGLWMRVLVWVNTKRTLFVCAIELFTWGARCHAQDTKEITLTEPHDLLGDCCAVHLRVFVSGLGLGSLGFGVVQNSKK